MMTKLRDTTGIVSPGQAKQFFLSNIKTGMSFTQ